MIRSIFVLLITLLALVAMFGCNYQVILSERDIASYTTPNSSVLLSIPLKTETSNSYTGLTSLYYHGKWFDVSSIVQIENKIPSRSSKFNFTLLFDYGPQPSWLGPTQMQVQSLTLIRGLSETRLNNAKISRIAYFQFRQSEFQKVSLFSSDLLESSPPGFFLLM
jgi:hypothetical protein